MAPEVEKRKPSLSENLSNSLFKNLCQNICQKFFQKNQKSVKNLQGDHSLQSYHDEASLQKDVGTTLLSNITVMHQFFDMKLVEGIGRQHTTTRY